MQRIGYIHFSNVTVTWASNTQQVLVSTLLVTQLHGLGYMVVRGNCGHMAQLIRMALSMGTVWTKISLC